METVRHEEALAELEHYVKEGVLPEMVPTQQERSLRSALAMLTAGRELLADRGLEDLSIEAVCQLAGTAVGAFYGRFGNKDAFFTTMQRLMSLRSQDRLAELATSYKANPVTVNQVVTDIVHLTVDVFRDDVGIMRASLQHSKEGLWRPIKTSGDKYRTVLADAITPHLQEEPELARMRVHFAYQAMVGVLVHSILNKPGPLHLESPELAAELVRLMTAYLAA